jgi:hypothetical protein
MFFWRGSLKGSFPLIYWRLRKVTEKNGKNCREIKQLTLEEIFNKSNKERNDIPTFLKPYTEASYPPNETISIYTSLKKDGTPTKRAREIILRFYGEYEGHKFISTDLTPKNFDQCTLQFIIR